MLIWLLLSPAVGLLALLLLDHVERQMVSSLTPYRQTTDASSPAASGASLAFRTHTPLCGPGHRRDEAVRGLGQPQRPTSGRPRPGASIPWL